MAKMLVPELFRKTAAYMLIKPATSQYPLQKTQLPESFRGQPVLNSSLCDGCGACSTSCPSRAIEMVEVNSAKYPQIDLAKCIFCNQCADICPTKAIINSHTFELATEDKPTLVIKPEITAFK